MMDTADSACAGGEGDCDVEAGRGPGCSAPGRGEAFALLKLPLEVLMAVMGRLEAISLARLELAARAFHGRHPVAGLRLTELAARDALRKRVGADLYGCWSYPSWKERLYLEESGVGFQYDLGMAEGFTFNCDRSGSAVKVVKLMGLGPKMLVSDLSTSEKRVLRWKLRVLGNTAVEFGAVPSHLQKRRKALHKCLTETGNAFCIGFCSQVTVGSQLPFRVPVVKGTTVDVLVRPGKAQFIVKNPADASNTHWENNHRVHTEYRGPGEISFTQYFEDDLDVKLALTAWAKAMFHVLHVCRGTVSLSQPAEPQASDAQDTEMVTC
ncbi:unnamed protein product [Ostreobium quekettii]|uniref:F-box domain-containing protein n=1 Tax=Ostreobium quekettii TaxID=121088 RepID=A0A8S1IUY0_9CHLO|nr:unnamed protein product [Ostreobium quekettii]|eukprot:evm.model.scf_295.1 EVM.evm.TU.scf_295.1   scf_295:4389-8160(+)